MRQTSLETYSTIRENGLLSRLRFLTYDCIFNHGPMTMGECCDKIKVESNSRTSGHENITPRFAELKRLGVIYEVLTRPCTITGRNCIEWDVTCSLPVKPEKRISERQRLLNEIEALKRENQMLKNQLNYRPVYTQSNLFA